MDWLLSPTEDDPASAAASLLGAHLRRHAATPDAVGQVLTDVRPALQRALGEPQGQVRMRLRWSDASPTLELCRVDEGAQLPDLAPGQVVPGRYRERLEGSSGEPFLSVPLPVERRVQEKFRAGPPPTPLVDVDPRRDGAASTAVALLAALDAHPTVSGPQAASLAGAIIAHAAVGDRTHLGAREAAELTVELQRALGGEAEVLVADDERIELAMTRCPYGPGVAAAGALCHVTTGLAGQLGARVHGEATVLLTEAIAVGDPECHLEVRLRPQDEDVRGETHQWPSVATRQLEPAPHLDLALALPRETNSVPVVRRLAAQALTAFGVVEEDVADVQVAITEACANVVEHATDVDTFEVKVELAANRCAITVVDQGVGFDTSDAGTHPPTEAESGRGLALMRALFDNVAFASEPQAGALVHMVKSLRFDHDHPLWSGSEA